MDEIIIRPAVIQDIDEIFEIEQRSFTVPWSREAFTSAFASAYITIYAAEHNGTVVGFGCISLLPPESEVLNIAVRPDGRGLGVGRRLLNEMLSHAKNNGADTAYLEVRASNTPARTLYETAGFVPFGIRKKYYEKPREDAVIMQKSPL